MRRLGRIIDGILYYFCGLALTALVGICFIQVVARYLFNNSFAWAEEISIVLLLWATWGGACLALKQGTHLKVRILEDRLAESHKAMLRMSLSILVVPFLVVITFASGPVLDAMQVQTLMSLPGVSMSVMYASVPFGTLMMLLYVIRIVAADVKFLIKGRGEKS
jgi:TRAP-type C4-dicarboxylate transport system permease small subunit